MKVYEGVETLLHWHEDSLSASRIEIPLCQFRWICNQPGSFGEQKNLLLTLPGNRVKVLRPYILYPSSKLAGHKCVFVAICLVQWQSVQNIISLFWISILKSAYQHTHYSVTQKWEKWRIKKSEQRGEKDATHKRMVPAEIMSYLLRRSNAWVVILV